MRDLTSYQRAVALLLPVSTPWPHTSRLSRWSRLMIRPSSVSIAEPPRLGASGGLLNDATVSVVETSCGVVSGFLIACMLSLVELDRLMKKGALGTVWCSPAWTEKEAASRRSFQVAVPPESMDDLSKQRYFVPPLAPDENSKRLPVT